MKTMLAWAAFVLLAVPAAPTIAQPVAGHTSLENGIGPAAPCASTDDATGRPVLCSKAAPLPASDAANASFTFAPTTGAAESSTAAAYTFSTASQQAARGWYANCPTNTAVTVTLIGVNGGSAPRTVYDGWQDSPDRLAGFSGNTGGCTFGERF